MPAGYSKLSTLSSGQNRLLKQLLGSLRGQSSNIQESPLYQQGSSFLQNLLSGSPEATSAFEAPYLRQFNEEIIPGLAERFTGMGAQRSSAFTQALGSAGSSLAESLAALKGQLGLQASGQGLQYAQQPISNYQGMAGLGLGTQSFGYVPKQQPFWQRLLMSLGQGGSEAVGKAFGSKLGGML